MIESHRWRDRATGGVRDQGRKGEPTLAQIELDHFSEGLAAYRARRWDEARRSFAAALESIPNDGPSMTFIRRIDRLATTPPDDECEGSWTSTEIS